MNNINSIKINNHQFKIIKILFTHLRHRIYNLLFLNYCSKISALKIFIVKSNQEQYFFNSNHFINIKDKNFTEESKRII